MQELLDKISEVTKDGSPSVGQWIELGDLAKKVGVKKVEMEKMVEETLANKSELKSVENPQPEEEREKTPSGFGRDISFDRPNFDQTRDQFQDEMMKRREQEDRMFERPEEVEIEQPEIVFPELKVSFDKPEEEPILEQEKIEPIETEPIAPVENVIEPPKQEEISAPEIEQIEFKVEGIDQKIEFEDISTTDFDQNTKDFSAEVQHDDIAEYIAESNQRAVEEARRLEEEKKKRAANKSSGQRKEQPRKKTQQRSQSDGGMVTLSDSKKARTIGIVAAVVAVLFGFIGIFIGIYGLSVSSKLKKEVEESSNFYGDQIKQNISIGRGLSFAGIVIGNLRFFNFIGDFF